MFEKIFNTFIPSVKAQDEDVVDPQDVLKEKCGNKGPIKALYDQYQQCNDRVNGRTKTTETCVQELFDYLHELDHCVAHSLFSKLK